MLKPFKRITQPQSQKSTLHTVGPEIFANSLFVTDRMCPCLWLAGYVDFNIGSWLRYQRIRADLQITFEMEINRTRARVGLKSIFK